jgi:hypothetical protein
MNTIEELKAAYASVLRPLTPPGYSVVVRLEDDKGRKKRKNAAARHWDPSSDKISITYEKVEVSPAPVVLPIPASQTLSHSRQISDVVRALDEAERTAAFVALKWFRDSVLPGAGFPWTASLDARQAVVKQAIDGGMFLTGRAPNPKSPAYPTTTIRLNRHSGDVQAILSATPSGSARLFSPVKIKGEPLSTTILKERR